MSEKKGDIIINVETNENKIPQKIKWTATEANIDNKECKAMFLALWDGFWLIWAVSVNSEL